MNHLPGRSSSSSWWLDSLFGSIYTTLCCFSASYWDFLNGSVLTWWFGRDKARPCFNLAKVGYQRFRHRSRTWGLRKLPGHKWAGRRMWSCHHSASPPPSWQHLLLPWLPCRLFTLALKLQKNSCSVRWSRSRRRCEYIHSHVMDYSNCWQTSVLYKITWR